MATIDLHYYRYTSLVGIYYSRLPTTTIASGIYYCQLDIEEIRYTYLATILLIFSYVIRPIDIIYEKTIDILSTLLLYTRRSIYQ